MPMRYTWICAFAHTSLAVQSLCRSQRSRNGNEHAKKNATNNQGSGSPAAGAFARLSQVSATADPVHLLATLEFRGVHPYADVQEEDGERGAGAGSSLTGYVIGIASLLCRIVECEQSERRI